MLRNQIIGEKDRTSNYIVAKSDLLPGAIIGAETMAVARITSKNMSAFSVHPDSFADYEGKVLKSPMSAGEPLLSHFVAGDGIERFSDLLEKNHRAITLEIDELSSASGMLVAGDFIDIMLVMENEDSSQGDDSKNLRPLLQNIKVLSVDAMPLVSKDQDFVVYNDDMQNYSNITVGLEFDDATKLVLARDVGDLVFMLRNKDDQTLNDTKLITLLNLKKATGSGSNYQYYSSSVSQGGVILPSIKEIISTSPIDNSKMIFSVKKKEKYSVKGTSDSSVEG